MNTLWWFLYSITSIWHWRREQHSEIIKYGTEAVMSQKTETTKIISSLSSVTNWWGSQFLKWNPPGFPAMKPYILSKVYAKGKNRKELSLLYDRAIKVVCLFVCFIHSAFLSLWGNTSLEENMGELISNQCTSWGIWFQVWGGKKAIQGNN